MIEIILPVIIGSFAGVSGTVIYNKRRQANGKVTIEKELSSAKNKASNIILKAKDEVMELENERRKEWKRTEDRLVDRENNLDKKIDDLDKRSERLRAEERDLEELKNEIHVISRMI